MKTLFTPSEKVLQCITAIDNLNANHGADIRGLLVALFFGDRYTKEEIKYIEQNVKPKQETVKKNNGWVADGESEFSYTGLQG